MTLSDSSNTLSGGSFLLKETSSGVKECLVWAVSCSVSWMYMLYPQPGEGTIHRLLPESFLWHKGNKLKGITQLLLAATTSSPWRFNPPNNDRAAPPVTLWIFTGHLFSLAKKKQSTREGCLVGFSLLCDSWCDVWKECQSFLIWVMLIKL